MEPRWTRQPQGTQSNRQRPADPRQAAYPPRQGTAPQQPYPPRQGTAPQQPYPPQQTGPQRPYPPQQTSPQQPSGRWTSAAHPFEEPESAPELASSRSEHLYNRDDRFWDTVGHERQRTGRHRRQADSGTVRWVVLILLALVAVGGIVYGTVFRVRTVSVKGNINRTASEVIALSGIRQGMSTFSIDDDVVGRNIERDRYLSFVCVDKQLPDTVVIQVRERIRAAAISYCGIHYVIDNRGMVLEEFPEKPLLSGIIDVEGLDIRYCAVGENLILSNQQQLDTYTKIMVELKVMGGIGFVKELDLSDMGNLFLVTTEGYVVRLGDSLNLHAKLRSMIMTRERLNRDGYKDMGGTIDVSAPINPTYSPEGV